MQKFDFMNIFTASFFIFIHILFFQVLGLIIQFYGLMSFILSKHPTFILEEIKAKQMNERAKQMNKNEQWSRIQLPTTTTDIYAIENDEQRCNKIADGRSQGPIIKLGTASHPAKFTLTPCFLHFSGAEVPL